MLKRVQHDGGEGGRDNRRRREEGASRQSRAVDRLAEYRLGLPSAGLALVRG